MATESLKLTTRGQYAIIAMVELAQHHEKSPLPLFEISEKAKISLSYLEQLISGLRRNGLVKSFRGPGGGYILAKPTKDIFISDILSAAEDCTPAKRHTNHSKKSMQCEKAAHLWDNIGKILYISLQSVSLCDVIKERVHENPDIHKLFEIKS